MGKGRIVLRVILAVIGIIVLLFGGLFVYFGIAMQGRQPLRYAMATLPQMREDFILMQPHLNTLLQAFPGRTPEIIAPIEHDDENYPLRLYYWVGVPCVTRIESRFRHDYKDWYALEWFSQDAIDAAVFLTSSPDLSHTLSEIWIEGLGHSTLIAYVNPWDSVTNTLIFRGNPNQRFAETYTHHHEDLGNGYFLRVHMSSFGLTLAPFVIGFGVVVIILGSIPMGFAIFMRRRLSMQIGDKLINKGEYPSV